MVLALLLGRAVVAQQPRTVPRPRAAGPQSSVPPSDSPGRDVTARERPAEIPFEQWIVLEKLNQIPWSIEISRPRLSILQRIVVDFRVAVPSKALRALGPTYQLFLALRLKPAGGGAWLEDGVHIGMKPQEQLPKNTYVEFISEALVLPGEYTAGFVLYDVITGRRSVAHRRLRVPGLSGDPLPEISKNLPPVEFFQEAVGGNSDYRPELAARLWMPVRTQRRVRVEVLVNFSPSEQFDGQRVAHQRNVSTMLGMLKVLSQMEFPNGSLRITALDVLHRSVIYEQDDVHDLDWPRLHNALKQMNPLRVSVKDLEERRRNAAFFRSVLRSHLEAPPGGPAARPARGTDGGEESHHVIFLLSSPQFFTENSDLDPLPPLEGCDCRIYHLQYRINSLNLWDQFPRILRRLRPTRFQLESPSDFRRALARILADLRAL